MSRQRVVVLLSGLLLLVVSDAAVIARAQEKSAPEDREGLDFFEKKIRPVLVERCYECHSKQAKKLRGGLYLDSRAGMLEGGNSGPVIVPGDPDQSQLIKAIRYTDQELKMPPKQRLSAQQVADFEAWVRTGAPDPRTQVAGDANGADVGRARRQWAFQAPKDPPIPKVRRQDWVKNPIDRFILAKLEEKGLQPAPAADKRTLLRRATYDLLGLPPKPEEIEAFLADESADAFAKVVDRLLASPRYGERWGRHWLDLVRYTDDFDEAWRYRDWVVKAFNEDMPYDGFIANQIAGDLLPAAGAVNADGIVATTMLAIGQWGGIDRKKRLTDIVDDQIDTIGRSFMGLTVACARCHDHKFDPVTSADYYGLAGIFFSSRIIPEKGYLSHGTARLRIPLVPPSEVEKHKQHKARLDELEQKLQTAVEKHYTEFAGSLLPQTARYLRAAWEYQNRPADQAKVSVEEFASSRWLYPFALTQWVDYLGGSRLGDYHLLEMPVRDFDGEAGIEAWRVRAERPWWAVNTTKNEVAIETFTLPSGTISVNPGTEGGAVGWKSPIAGTVRITGKLTDADPDDGVGVTWVIDHASDTARRELSSGSMPNGGVRRLDQGRTPERLMAVQVKPGDMIYLHVRLREGDAHYDITNVELKISCLDSSAEWDLARDARSNFLAENPHRDGLGHAAVWHFYDTTGSERLKRMPAVEPLLKRFVGWPGLSPRSPGASSSGASRTQPRPPQRDGSALEMAAQEFQRGIEAAGPERALVQDLTGIRSPFWVNNRDDAKYLSSESQMALAKLADELKTLKDSAPPLPSAHGIQEGGIRYSLYPGIQDVPIHIRGSYERLGQRVPRHFPEVLATDKQTAIRSGSGRLELARWLGSADHPLTARVMVNRIWQHHFGEGIVRTPSNFGAKGEPPTHPELLDYLARRFVESGWSIKTMHRLMLLSDAYQQSSKAGRPGSDPDNRLFGRMNRQRLEAEELSDSLLAVSDCLDDSQGGPANGDPLSPRRMLYLSASRSDRAGFRALFDAADPSIHVEKRTASTVAPQALFLMNSPLIVDKVSRLVNRPEVVAAAELDKRIQALYRLVFGRHATEEEVKLGRRFIEALPAKTAEPKQETPALGPWEAYAQALLLSNEFLFVD